jgi:hypothetical protein
MEKEEKIYEMMVELGQLLGQMTRENTQLLEFVREKNLLPAFEEYKKRDDAARLYERNQREMRKVQESAGVIQPSQKDRKPHRSRKPVKTRLP